MEPLFRIERIEGYDGGLIGYDWIEVLAIEPWALAFPGDGYGDWCDRRISNYYICLTPVGLMRITSDDFWVALEDYNEYDLETDNISMPKYVVTTGESSIVQLHGTIHGDVSTSRSGDTVGAKGDGAQGIVMSSWLPPGSSLQDLQAELRALRIALRDKSDTPEQDMAIAAVAEAEIAAGKNNEKALKAALKKGGKWVLDTAKDIGLEVAKAAVKHAIGS
ncbi:hypothetical protein [Actinophytocola sp.]|uniref:hypothetical protein n=1 Tax=Actinophytocola sp. TaxID=1872138 RepID=UPI00389A2711